MGVVLLANEVSIALLLVGQGIKMLRDLQSHDTRRRIGEILAELLSVHVEVATNRWMSGFEEVGIAGDGDTETWPQTSEYRSSEERKKGHWGGRRAAW